MFLENLLIPHSRISQSLKKKKDFEIRYLSLIKPNLINFPGFVPGTVIIFYVRFSPIEKLKEVNKLWNGNGKKPLIFYLSEN